MTNPFDAVPPVEIVLADGRTFVRQQGSTRWIPVVICDSDHSADFLREYMAEFDKWTEANEEQAKARFMRDWTEVKK